MKPTIIFVNEENGHVTLEKDDLQRIVDEAYEAGKKDESFITKPCTLPNYVYGRETQITC